MVREGSHNTKVQGSNPNHSLLNIPSPSSGLVLLCPFRPYTAFCIEGIDCKLTLTVLGGEQEPASSRSSLLRNVTC
jgi:hypothetical protein